jgi:transposase InsO family protein
MRYRVIREHDRRYPIRLMCRALAVSAAGYYAWRSRHESARSIQTGTLLSAIRVLYQESRETYGSPRIWDALVKQGHRIGEHCVARLMRQAGIRAKTVTKGRATTQSQHRFPVAANILDRAFTVEAPNRVWAGDLTYVWTLEGWLYLAVLLDTYSKIGFAKLYDRKTPITAADLLNDRVLPFFEQHEIPLNRILTDRSTEYCGAPERHEYELYLAVENIDHTRTKTRHPQTNGICERFHKTMLNRDFPLACVHGEYRGVKLAG